MTVTDPLLRDLAKREQRVVGDLVPGQQGDRVGNQAGGQAVLAREDFDDAPPLARPQGENVAHFGFERCRIDRRPR